MQQSMCNILHGKSASLSALFLPLSLGLSLESAEQFTMKLCLCLLQGLSEKCRKKHMKIVDQKTLKKKWKEK